MDENVTPLHGRTAAQLTAHLDELGVSPQEFIHAVTQHFQEQVGDGSGGAPGAAFGLPGLLAGGALDHVDDLGRRQPTLLPRRAEPASYRLRVDLAGARPPIWRRIVVPSDLTLDRLHMMLQVVMGWEDAHLHCFRVHGDRFDIAPFLTAYDVAEGDTGIQERDVRLDEVLGQAGDKLDYDYDFGDGWRHVIKLEEVRPAGELGCLAGRRACPPEDCGGLPGYEEIIDILSGRGDGGFAFESREEMLSWLPPGWAPDVFDLAAAEAAVRTIASPDFGRPPAVEELHPVLADMLTRHPGSPATAALEGLVGATLPTFPAEVTADAGVAAGPEAVEADSVKAITHRLQVLLEAVGDGVQLTAAGYLPPRVVERVFTGCGMGEAWIGAGNREDLTPPVADLREAAQQVGLLRKQGRRLAPTTSAKAVCRDTDALWRHVASRLVAGRGDQKEAGTLLLLMVASGELPPGFTDILAELLAQLGWRDGSAAGDDFWEAALPTWLLLHRLGCLERNRLTDRAVDLATAALWPDRQARR